MILKASIIIKQNVEIKYHIMHVQLLLNYRMKPLYFGGFFFEMTWLLEHFPRIHENGVRTPLAKNLNR